MKHRLGRSNGSVTVVPGSRSYLSTGIASPVSAAWLTCKSFVASSRRSAGTRSPAESCTMSPGTSWSIGTSCACEPSACGRRRTVAVVFTIARSSAAARLERCSCTKANPTLSTTINVMTTAARASPVSQETRASESSSAFNGFLARPASSRGMLCGRSRAIWFGPIRANRSAASVSLSPSSDVPSLPSNCPGAIRLLETISAEGATSVTPRLPPARQHRRCHHRRSAVNWRRSCTGRSVMHSQRP